MGRDGITTVGMYNRINETDEEGRGTGTGSEGHNVAPCRSISYGLVRVPDRIGAVAPRYETDGQRGETAQ